ncbi:MAG: phosphatase PAP2 family protein [Verrucomicrobiota bacterium]|nr:phosphatase PAP2 family protein [Verrucomicrobiota bacterium]
MDHALFHLINEQWTSPALDLFMAALSDLQVWLPLIIVLVLALLIFGGFRGRAFIICLSLTLIFSEAAVVQTIKKAVGRPRPKQAGRVRLVQLQPTTPKFLSLFQPPRPHYSEGWDRKPPGQGNSFPSAHVANNFVVGTFCVLFFGRWGGLYFLIAALVSYSRIYLGAHWPSDVAGTVVLAVAEALLLATFWNWFWRKLAPRWCPEVFAQHPHLFGKAERK